jgi:transposase-like protein
MDISDEQLTRLREKLASAKSYEDLMGKDGAIKDLLSSALTELLDAELTAHLGYEKHSPAGRNTGNSRNGKTKKSILTEHGPIEIPVPRDREGTFEPAIVKKHQRRLGKLEDQVISMYARGMSTRDISDQIEDLYGVELSASAVSQITDRILQNIADWQNRPLEPVYPFVFFDAVHYPVRDEGRVINKAVYSCLAVTVDGGRDLLGLWIGEAESATFWHGVITELRNRGVEDIFIACVDGIKGFTEAMAAVFPQTAIQRCIIHQIRNSFRHVPWKDRKAVAKDLRTVYGAATSEGALAALDSFEETWGARYPLLIKSWRTNWPELSTYFVYPKEIRRLIYTTNAVEALHRQFRKVTKSKSVFPHDDSLRKILYLAYHQLSYRWTMAVRNWPFVYTQLVLLFDDRMPNGDNRD